MLRLDVSDSPRTGPLAAEIALRATAPDSRIRPLPNLPSITVTDTQLAKCVAAFTDAAGYKAWLKAAVRDEVLRRESRRLDEEANTAKRDALAAMESELPAPDPA